MVFLKREYIIYKHITILIYCECAWKVLIKAALGQMVRHLELVCRKEALYVLYTVDVPTKSPTIKCQ